MQNLHELWDTVFYQSVNVSNKHWFVLSVMTLIVAVLLFNSLLDAKAENTPAWIYKRRSFLKVLLIVLIALAGFFVLYFR